MTMQTIKRAVVKFAKDEDGLTIVEYAVAGGLITAVVAAAFVALGGEVKDRINEIIVALGGTAVA
ncbi:Flp family type IVb pilin [Stutzerimonas stutzeri]|uniref:Flp family type IVb pilin n=1 Tax=Stutzerimonas stutzeri TaxID=316 RepID=UPI001BCC42BE|nr:Flp family type IVb pilin [Stutzerimonas stutzeri]UVO19773.1 Flp family type IVb pilin [Stutzerimonas stutzeri]